MHAPTKKNGQSYYGYKNHIKADEKSKLIDAYTVRDASVHDSQETEILLSEIDFSNANKFFR